MVLLGKPTEVCAPCGSWVFPFPWNLFVLLEQVYGVNGPTNEGKGIYQCGQNGQKDYSICWGFVTSTKPSFLFFWVKLCYPNFVRIEKVCFFLLYILTLFFSLQLFFIAPSHSTGCLKCPRQNIFRSISACLVLFSHQIKKNVIFSLLKNVFKHLIQPREKKPPTKASLIQYHLEGQSSLISLSGFHVESGAMAVVGWLFLNICIRVPITKTQSQAPFFIFFISCNKILFKFIKDPLLNACSCRVYGFIAACRGVQCDYKKDSNGETKCTFVNQLVAHVVSLDKKCGRSCSRHRKKL